MDTLFHYEHNDIREDSKINHTLYSSNILMVFELEENMKMSGGRREALFTFERWMAEGWL